MMQNKQLISTAPFSARLAYRQTGIIAETVMVNFELKRHL